MINSKRITAFLVSVIVCICAVFTAAAVGTDELALTVNTVGSYELDIGLKNVSENYLANLAIRVESDKSGTKISSYGFDSGDSVRSVAPGESVSAYAAIDPASVTTTAAKTTASAQMTKPVQTTKPAQTSATVQKDQPQGNDYVNDADTESVYQYSESVEPDVQVTESVSDGTTGSDVTSDTTEGTGSSEETTVHTIHSIAPGEETTVSVSLETESESETAAVTPSEESSSYTVWIVVGVVAVIGIVAAVVIIVKKKKVPGDIASVIVIAVLLSALIAGETANVVMAADINEPVAGSVSKTVTLEDGNGTVTVTVDYTVVPKAQAEPLKSMRRPPAGDECDNANMNIRRIVPGVGPLTDLNIYVGDNGFMYFGQAIEDYTGKTMMTDLRYNKLVQMMNDRDEWARENGIKLYLVIAPNKSTVYPEYVPDKVKAAKKTNADAAIEALAAGSTVEVIDLRGALVDAKAEYGDSMFYKYDTHWNNNGGFVGYTDMMRRISEDVPGTYTMKKSDYDIEDYETYMKDMAYYLGHYSAFTDYGPVYTLRSGMTATLTQKSASDRHGQFRFCSMWKNGYSDALKYVVFENTYNTGAPDVYMYRDSFSVSMIHFVKDSFGKSVFDWSYDFNRQNILDSGAEVVIMEVVEKQLEDFVNARTFVG